MLSCFNRCKGGDLRAVDAGRGHLGRAERRVKDTRNQYQYWQRNVPEHSVCSHLYPLSLCLLLFLGRSLRLRTGNRLLRRRRKVLLVHPDAGVLLHIFQLVFQLLRLQFLFDLGRYFLQILPAALDQLNENKRAGSIIQFSPLALLKGECRSPPSSAATLRAER